MKTKFLLLLGVSGVGKSTIISELCKIDNRFKYISPYMTRRPRKGEIDKIYVTTDILNEMDKKGEIISINENYGAYYATPLNPILEALDRSHFPVLDWPVKKLAIMAKRFSDRIYSVYLVPPSIEELRNRLANDDRDKEGLRFTKALEELKEFENGLYNRCYNLCLTTYSGESHSTAKTIYAGYLASISKKLQIRIDAP